MKQHVSRIKQISTKIKRLCCYVSQRIRYLFQEVVVCKLLLKLFCLRLLLLDFFLGPLDFQLFNTDNRNVFTGFQLGDQVLLNGNYLNWNPIIIFFLWLTQKRKAQEIALQIPIGRDAEGFDGADTVFASLLSVLRS